MIPTRPEFDKTINKILQGSEYKHLRNPITDFLDYIKDAISRFIFGLLKGTFSVVKASSISKSLSSIFIILGILTICAIIILIFMRINKTQVKKKRVKEILGEKIDIRTTPNSLRQKASIKETEGEFRLAIRYEFIAILLLMHQLNLLYLDETQTNEEIHNYLKAKHFTYIGGIKELINIFNYIWYGHKEPDKQLYDTWKYELEGLWNGVIKYEEKG
jgi:hypothetical protein